MSSSKEIKANKKIEKPRNIIAVFNEIRTLRFKIQLAIALFAAVNHIIMATADSQQAMKNKNKHNGSKSTNHN